MKKSLGYLLAQLRAGGHCPGSTGSGYGRGIRCNCRRCPGSAASENGGWADRPPCRACRLEG